MTVPARATTGDIMEEVLLKGDLAKLSPEDRVRYYNEVCKSVGLNPLTQPFAYVTLNGKLQLYALRSCADQLRKINNVSLEVVSRDVSNGILTVHVRATMGDRRDEDLGSVAFPDTLHGEARANAELKAVTKAKRRVTLSICGLGWLDENEVADIAGARRSPPIGDDTMKPIGQAAAAVVAKLEPPHDPVTGEIHVGDAPGPSTLAADGKSSASESGRGQPAPDQKSIDFDWIKYGQAIIERVKEDPAIADDLPTFARMEAEAPKVFKRMMAAIAKLRPKAEEPVGQPKPKDDPELYLKWLKETVDCIETAKGLGTFRVGQEPLLADAFPSDAAAAMDVINARMVVLTAK